MPTLCIGHRGAKGYRPENTLASFRHAIEMGCDWIELDVHLVEGELVVIHDASVDRTTDGSGSVEAFTFEALRRLDAGDGEQIPTLREVTDLVDQRCGINVELKGKGTADAVCQHLQALVDQGWDKNSFLISSFYHKELAASDPTFLRGVLFAKRMKDEWTRAENLRAYSVNYAFNDVDASLVSAAHEKGYQVLAYTVNEPEDITRMLALGVDGVFSDYPDRVLSNR